MLIIGSKALHAFGLTDRYSIDTDIICTYEELQKQVSYLDDIQEAYPLGDNKFIVKYLQFGKPAILEAEIAWEGSCAEELLHLLDISTERMEFVLAKPDVQLALKMSHRFKKNSPHFRKTMDDIITLRQAGAQIPDYLQDWFKRREEETYDYSHPKLNQKKGEFFDSSVTYTYDHDHCHEVVAIGDEPAYKSFIKPGSEVFCDMDVFESLPLEIRLRAGFEESMVLNIERWLVPNDFKTNPKQGFLMALEKICTSITSGRFREFCWENYDNIREMWDVHGEDSVTRFIDKMKKGEVRRHGEVY